MRSSRCTRHRCGRRGTPRSGSTSTRSATRSPRRRRGTPRSPRGTRRRPGSTAPRRSSRSPAAFASGLAIQSSHAYAQFGLAASDAIIQVSDHPVVPSSGSTTSVLPVGDRVLDDLPGGADDRVTGLERLDLLEVVRPVLADVLALGLQQVDRRSELRLVERVRVLDAEVGLRRHQVHGGVRDVDRRVVGGHLAGVGGRVVEDGAPRGRGRRGTRPCCTSAGSRRSRAGCRRTTPSTLFHDCIFRKSKMPS